MQRPQHNPNKSKMKMPSARAGWASGRSVCALSAAKLVFAVPVVTTQHPFLSGVTFDAFADFWWEGLGGRINVFGRARGPKVVYFEWGTFSGGRDRRPMIVPGKVWPGVLHRRPVAPQ